MLAMIAVELEIQDGFPVSGVGAMAVTQGQDIRSFGAATSHDGHERKP